jgi:hypothetical protein
MPIESKIINKTILIEPRTIPVISKLLPLALDCLDLILARSIMPHINAAMPGPVPNNGNKEQIPVTNEATARPLGFSSAIDLLLYIFYFYYKRKKIISFSNFFYNIFIN